MANKNKYTFKDSSEALDAMGAAMGEYQNNAYKSGYDDKIKTMSDSILGQKKFSYDPNSDPTYRYAKKSYEAGGRKAMKDTQAQAAALTGGYGNSYGQIAGQQVYGDYMSRLSDMIPELEARKYQRYRDDQSERYQQLAMLRGLDDRDFSRWQYGDQKLGAAVDYLGGVRDTLYGAERDKIGDQRYADETAYNRSLDERNFDYQKQRDAVGDRHWQDEFDLNSRMNAYNTGSGSGAKGSKRGNNAVTQSAEYKNIPQSGINDLTKKISSGNFDLETEWMKYAEYGDENYEYAIRTIAAGLGVTSDIYSRYKTYKRQGGVTRAQKYLSEPVYNACKALEQLEN